MRDVVQWTTPAPLWPRAAAGPATRARRTELLRPSLLRFASDSFMEDLLALLEQNPAALGGLVARPETWRDLVAAPAPPASVPKFALPFSRARLAGERREQSALAPAAAPLAAGGGAVNVVAQGAGAALKPLKLYQPAHLRYYLLTSCLVCARAGLPDRALDTTRDERATFVVRRLFPATITDGVTGATRPFLDAQKGEVDRSSPRLPEFDETWEEYAFVSTPAGEAGWQKVIGAGNPAADVLVAGEEQLPLFPMSYTEDSGRRRRVFAGLAPVGKREDYMGAAYLPQSSGAGQPAPAAGGAGAGATPDAAPFDPRLMRLWLEVTEPWKRLYERAVEVGRMHAPTAAAFPPTEDEDMPPDGETSATKAAREQFQTGSWYALLDFSKFLEENLTSVWEAILAPALAADLEGAGRALYDALGATTLNATLRTQLIQPANFVTAGITDLPPVYTAANVMNNLRAALAAIREFDSDPTAEDRLESVAISYDRHRPDPGDATKPDPAWPTFLFPLADHKIEGPLPPPAAGVADDPDPVKKATQRIDHLSDLVKAALPPPPPPPPVRAPVPLAARKVMDTREGYFVMRCVYERPLCGPLDQPVVSAPTREFQLAAFFDPDAPARPIRIGLPIDTSPAGLRKFDKNTAFMMSDMLCGQVQRMKGLTLGDLIRSVLPWPLHKDLSVPDGGPCAEGGGLQVGMICSLSIPIITLCALLLLMIIVSLLDFIFRWIPYFLICFPLPGFGAKK